ncbi:MAG: hypothetical protein KGL53_01725 [Elusimicrobia bacterium]|nr:hypothetical protein [Elusimicrobiota bacterium]
MKVSTISFHRDDTLVHGGYDCVEGKVAKALVRRLVPRGAKPHRRGDKVSFMLDCQPDGVPFGPGQLPRPLCSKARKAEMLRVGDSSVDFPREGCPQADAGFAVVPFSRPRRRR